MEQCKGVHCVDLGESFQTHIYVQNLASIQPRTTPVKFACSPCTDPPGAKKISRIQSIHEIESDSELEAAMDETSDEVGRLGQFMKSTQASRPLKTSQILELLHQSP